MILATSAMAFAMVKYAGVAYLIWIGTRFFLSPGDTGGLPDKTASGGDRWKIFRQGMLTNVLNPKVALFFLSFLPQFVSFRTESVFLPFMMLSLVFFTTGSIWCLILVHGAGWLSRRFRGHSAFGGGLKRLSGILFIGLDIRLAFAKAQ